jgi:hypothetical protein
VEINSATKPGDGLTGLDSPSNDRITQRYDCCTPSRWISVNSARSSMLVWALYGERLDGRDPATGLPPAGSGVLVDGKGNEHPEVWPKVAEHAAYVAGMPESEKRLIARWLDLGAPKFNTHNDMMRPVLTLTPVAGGSGSVSTVRIGVWDDSPLDYSRFSVTANGASITPTISGTPTVINVTLPTAVTESNADTLEFVFEIWDQPDRSLSYLSPGVSAANRTRKVVTGRKLLDMLSSTAVNLPPNSTSATIVTTMNQPSAGVIPAVDDPDIQDSHLFSIVTQPAHGSAAVVNNRLVYTPNTGYTGADSFTFKASDLGGLSVNGTATVNVTAAPPPSPTAPTITTQPASKSVMEGLSVVFEVAATGSGTLSYQWRRGSVVIAGATSATYQIGSVTLADNNSTYSCVVTNAAGSVTSASATLTVTAATSGSNGADNFDDQNTDGWTPLTGSRWSVVQDGGDFAYFLNTSAYDNLSGDRLGEYTLLAGSYGDFTLTLQARLGDALAGNPQADFAVVFGYQDANNYYYMMFNADQTYTQLYKVVNGTRNVLASAGSDLLNDTNYHSVEVSRSGNVISVKFDSVPVIPPVTDSTFGAGQVGIGSFNDSAYFDDVRLVAGTGNPGGGTPGGGGGTGSGGGDMGGGNGTGGTDGTTGGGGNLTGGASTSSSKGGGGGGAFEPMLLLLALLVLARRRRVAFTC